MADKNKQQPLPPAPEPGTRAFNEQQPPELRIPDAQTNEGMAELSEGKPQATPGLHFISDEYENNLRGGRNMNEEIAAPYVEANPDKAFRVMTKQHCESRGTRGWKPVRNAEGRAVTILNEGRWLGWKPKEVRDAVLKEHQEVGNRARRQAQERMVETALRAESGLGGKFRATRDGGAIGGVPITTSTRRGRSVLD